MRRTPLHALLLLLLLLPAAAVRAQGLAQQAPGGESWQPPPEGPYAGLQLGFGLPLGRFEHGGERRALSEVYDSAVPLQVEVGYRFSPSLRAGVYAAYARLLTQGFCPGALECRASLLRVGVSGEYHFAPGRRLHGWVGLGAGLEHSGVRIQGSGVDVETRYRGLEWLNASTGADLRLTRALSVGPALTWTLGRYATRESRLGSGEGAEPLEQPALHGWVLLGARARWAF